MGSWKKNLCRPLDVRLKESNKPCPRIDHRPLGADSYSNSPESIKNIKINQPKRNENNSTSCNNKKEDLGSKFQDVQVSYQQSGIYRLIFMRSTKLFFIYWHVILQQLFKNLPSLFNFQNNLCKKFHNLTNNQSS